MDNEIQEDAFVFSSPVIDFVTVAAETCLFLENADSFSKEDFVSRSLKILALLYLKSSVIEVPERYYDDNSERFVTEAEYNEMQNELAALLGEDDSYLETFHPDMALSDTPVAAFVSENLSDIYQELKDFATNYQLADEEIMHDALVTCLEGFAEHWGQKTLNALKALHAFRYSDRFGEKEEELPEDDNNIQQLNRNTFLNYLRDEDEDELSRLI